MRYGSVCSGIEAATAAWRPLGWEASFFSEIEKFPRAVLSHHYPEVPLHGDFTTIEDGDYEPIDLLVGGTPCQSFSIAGLRKGLDDERGNLALEYLRLAQRLRPSWLVWENVPGVLSSNGGRDFGAFLGGLVELGYGFAYRVLDAQYFGVAQRRRRVFVVGYLGDWRRAAAVLFERDSLSGNPPPRREAGEKASAALTAGTGGGGANFNRELVPMTSSGNQQTEIAKCLTTRTGSALDPETETLPVCFPSNTNAMQAAGYNVCPSMLTTASPAVAYGLPGNWIGRKPENGGNQVEPFIEQSPCQTSTDRHAVASYTTQITSPQNGSNPKAGDPCHPLAAAAHPPAVASSMAVRRLTPVECERLQGFPDDFTRIPYRNKPADQCSDGPRYKALGNSMAVPVMAWIGERIQQVEALDGN